MFFTFDLLWFRGDRFEILTKAIATTVFRCFQIRKNKSLAAYPAVRKRGAGLTESRLAC